MSNRSTLFVAAVLAAGFSSAAFAGAPEVARSPRNFAGSTAWTTPFTSNALNTLPGATVAIPPFNAVVSQVSSSTLEPTYQILSPIAAGTYYGYTVSVDWSELTGGPYSSEGLIAFTNAASVDVGTTFYADPGPAANSADDSNAVTLSWTGVFDMPYDPSVDPLYFVMAQTYAPSSANWNNVTISLSDVPPPPTVTVNFAGDTTGDPRFNRPSSLSSLSSVGTDIEYEVVPFHVTDDGSYKVVIQPGPFDSYGLVYSGSFDPNDPLANLISAFDTSPSPYVGQPDETTVSLLAGTQYYVVVTGFEDGFDYGPYTGTISNALGFAGSPVLGFVPEPASLSVIGGAVLMVVRRRRAA